MKILHLSTADLRGGAALSAYRLHRGLLLAGEGSSMLVRDKIGRDATVHQFVLPMDWVGRIKRKWRRRQIVRDIQPYRRTMPPGFELFSDDRSPFGASMIAQMEMSDVVHLHWVAAFLDYGLFFETLPKRQPIVWTLHDMNAFTGGCHYDMGCGRYAQQCGACPQLGSISEDDLARAIWNRKVQAFRHVEADRMCIVTPSRWLGQAVQRSSILSRYRVEVIPYGIDLEAFAPRDRAVSRDVLGIPQSAKVVLFLAEIVTNRRKGFQVLSEALAGCTRDVEELWLLSVGQQAPFRQDQVRGSHLPYIGEERFLSLAYSAADLFVIPSLQDNLPNTVLEAMACGVPVIGCDVGGIKDMVRPGATGVLVPAGDLAALRGAIVNLLHNHELRKAMARQSRKVAIEEYALELQARRYTELYKELCA